MPTRRFGSSQASRSAKLAEEALKDLRRYVAGIQIGITLCGIGAGAVAEPFVTDLLAGAFGTAIDRRVSLAIAVLVVLYLMVVVGELVPKYATLHHSDRSILYFIRPLRLVVMAFSPLIWLIEGTGALILRAFRIRLSEQASQALPKEELLLLIRAQSAEGVLDEVHAQMVSRALRFDKLTAEDIMVHRMDVEWLDADTPKERLLETVARFRHTRIPVCRGDIDLVIGVLYLQDLIRHLGAGEPDIEAILRPVVRVPENLTMDKTIERMREERTQILIVSDEYGGTSGIVTLEDVVEEVFGELEDRLEFERPPIEVHDSGRVSARAEVRFDEVVSKLEIELEGEPSTDTLATLFVNGLERVPRLGDTIDTPIGVMRVENMARSRITRVSLRLSAEFREQAKASNG
jgi:CBS domain containing-hemolysin-like protein